jgi:hypothetical protein
MISSGDDTMDNVPLASEEESQEPPLIELEGSCLCEWIKFKITFPWGIQSAYPLQFTSSGKLRATNCHCNKCRKSTGALFGTWAHVPANFLKITDLAMNMGSYRIDPISGRCRKFCRVCGTSLFITEEGWDVVPEDLTKVDIESMYNREFNGKDGWAVDVSVGAMDVFKAKDLVEIVEHIYLDDTIDGRHAFLEPEIPR